MALRIYNTLTRKKEPFETLEPGVVRMYVCGPTVYDKAHIGHAMSALVFDIIRRYLEYRGYTVKFVMNFTDVDDKIIRRAQELGEDPFRLAERYIEDYRRNLQALNVKPATVNPRATQEIEQIIAMIQGLIEKGHAYVVNGDVYFRVTSDPDYGKLSGRRLEEMQAGARIEVDERKEHPMDFALWKAAKPGEPSWSSPWGKGRPGWHIECSAMSVKYLGETFDIHGGGMDLMFPHHENEIAQSETCFDKPFAKYWLHNGLTRFNTKKISKSDQEMARKMGELTLTHLLSKHSPELLRYFIISTHYRRPIEFSDEEIAAKKKGLDTFYRLFERIERACRQDPYQDGPTLEQAFSSTENHADQSFIRECLDHQLRFLEAMDDDFNTGGAVGSLFEMATTINRFIDEWRLETEENPRGRDLAMAAVQTLRSLARILGLFDQRPPRAATTDHLVDDLMDVLIALRAEARKAKQYTLADLVRDRLKAVGISLEDRPGGTVWRRES